MYIEIIPVLIDNDYHYHKDFKNPVAQYLD